MQFSLLKPEAFITHNAFWPVTVWLEIWLCYASSSWCIIEHQAEMRSSYRGLHTLVISNFKPFIAHTDSGDIPWECLVPLWGPVTQSVSWMNSMKNNVLLSLSTKCWQKSMHMCWKWKPCIYEEPVWYQPINLLDCNKSLQIKSVINKKLLGFLFIFIVTFLAIAAKRLLTHLYHYLHIFVDF